MRHNGSVMNNPTDSEPGLVVVQPDAEAQAEPGADGPPSEGGEAIEQPAKVMRIGSMIRQLLEEVRQAPLDEASRIRLREIYDTSLSELADGLSPDLSAELARMAPAFHPEAIPTDAELRIAQAQLVGWLEGLFHGIQATLYAQQMAQRMQMEEASRRGLPSGGGRRDEGEDRPMPGTYL